MFSQMYSKRSSFTNQTKNGQKTVFREIILSKNQNTCDHNHLWSPLSLQIEMFTFHLILSCSQHPGKSSLLILKGPSLQAVLDVRQARVLVTSRHSFTIKIQSVPTNLTISFIHTGGKKPACVFRASQRAEWGWLCLYRPVYVCVGVLKVDRRTCGWYSVSSSWSLRCHSCGCILHKDPTCPSDPHWAPEHNTAVYTLIPMYKKPKTRTWTYIIMLFLCFQT